MERRPQSTASRSGLMVNGQNGSVLGYIHAESQNKSTRDKNNQNKCNAQSKEGGGEGEVEDDDADRYNLAMACFMQFPDNWLDLPRDARGHVIVVTPTPENEEERLKELYRQELYEDSTAEESFDRITRITARVLKFPIAVMNLIGSEIQRFKSEVGLGASQLPRQGGFCPWVLTQKNLRAMVVPDSLLDPRFVNNPYVTGPPYIRFYAGAPLITRAGYKLGTLCVIDTVPREMDESQLRTLIDMSELMMDEMELRLSRRHAKISAQVVLSDVERLQYSINSLSEGLIMWDSAHRIIFANGGFHRMTGWQNHDVQGTHALDLLIGPETNPSFQSRIKKAFEALCIHGSITQGTPISTPTDSNQRMAHTIETVLYRRNNTWFWAQLNLTVVAGKQDGSTPGTLLGVLTDIHIQKMAEHARMRAEAAATESAEAKNLFLSKFSDELRVPLNALISASARWQQTTESTPQQSELTDIIDQSSAALVDLADTILDFQKLGEEKLELKQRPTNIRAILQKYSDTMYIKAKAKGLRLTVRVGDGVPETLYIDEVRLGQIVRNLLKNAINFTDSGSVGLVLTSRPISPFYDDQHHSNTYSSSDSDTDDLSDTDENDFEHSEDGETADNSSETEEEEEEEEEASDRSRRSSQSASDWSRRGSQSASDYDESFNEEGGFCAASMTPYTRFRQRRKSSFCLISGRTRIFIRRNRKDSSCEEEEDPGATIHELSLRVTDTGKGLSKAEREQLFKRFSQADQAVTRRVGGVGLGLAFSRKLAQLMGGGLVLESTEEKKGSTFLCAFQAASPSPAFWEGSSTSLRILIADPAQESTTVKLLKLIGTEVISTAANGEDVLQHLRDGRQYDVILMNSQLPDMSAAQCRRALIAICPYADRPLVYAMSGEISTTTIATPPTGPEKEKETETENASSPQQDTNKKSIEAEEAECKEAGLDGYLRRPFVDTTPLSDVLKTAAKQRSVNLPYYSPHCEHIS